MPQLHQTLIHARLVAILCTVFLLAIGTGALRAQERMPAPADVLSLDATVHADIAPDLAIIVLAIDREGPDAATLTRDINQALGQALATARTHRDIEATTGGYTSYPRQDNRGKRTGWQIRAELILKSRDFARLGQLAGQFGNDLQVTSSRFEVSPSLRAAEEARLLDAAAEAFRSKAAAAAKAFGFSNYRLREVQLGSAGQHSTPRPVVLRSMVREGGADAAPVPLESGRVTLSLTVSGSVQMQR